MQKIFEEYGQTILAVLVAAFLLVGVLGGAYFFKTLRDETNVNAEVSYSKSDEALEKFSERAKPNIEVTDTDLLHLHINETFKPIASVSCTDTDGNTLVATVESIVFVDGNNGLQTEFTERYDSTNDTFDVADVVGKTGTLAVTYKTIDGYNVISKKTISFAIDAAAP